jgi:hypothetical protein
MLAQRQPANANEGSSPFASVLGCEIGNPCGTIHGKLIQGCDRNPMWGMVRKRDPAPSRSFVIFTLLVIVILRQIWIEIIK